MLSRLVRTALLAACLAQLAACDPAAEDDPDAPVNIAVSITGIDGTLALFNSGVGAFGITATGNVTIGTHAQAGSAYNITIARHPYGQTCSIANGSGIAGSDVSTVLVTCAVSTYPVTFNVSGLSGDLVLTNNGFDPVTVSGDGTYAFAAPATFGDPYSVAIITEPVGHACSVTGGSGTATDTITGIQVQCTAVDPMMIREVSITATGPKFLRVDWQQVPTATYYRLLRDADGIPGGPLVQVGVNTTNRFAVDRVSVHLRTLYIYVVEACDALHCVASVPADTTGMLSQAIGYLKADWSYATAPYFGWKTALSSNGQTLAVASIGLGSYLFVRPANYWKQQARIALNPPGTYDRLGYAVALSADGNTLAVGEGTTYGAVRTYVRSNGIWSPQATLPAPSTQTYVFGRSLALSASGNTLIVGDPGYASGTGRAYLYERTGTTWNSSSVLHAANQHTNAAFGSSVSIAGDGNTLAVGSSAERGLATGVSLTPTEQLDSANPSAGYGAAYVFVRSGGTWVLQTYLKPSALTFYSGFGASVSLSSNGNELAVGAPGDNNARTGLYAPNDRQTLYRSGAAYVFARTGTAWAQQVYVKAAVTDEHDGFGHAVSLSGDGRTLAVGAPYEDSAGNDLEPGMESNDASIDSGAAYVFRRQYTYWRAHRYLKAPINGPGDYFGYSVTLSADSTTLAVGAIYESSAATGINGLQGGNGSPQSGATYLY